MKKKDSSFKFDAEFRKKALIVIAWIAGILFLVVLIYILYISAQFRVYHDNDNKFSIKYPSFWKVVIHPRENVAVAFLRPKDTVMDTLQENFNVTVQPVPIEVTTLEAFTATIKKQMTGVFGKSIKIVEDKPLHWGWHEGHLMAIEAPNPDHLKMVNAWVLYHGQAYIMTFLGDMNKYAKDALLVNVMIKSLELQ